MAPFLPRHTLAATLAAFEANGGNKERTAKALGIARSTLDNRLMRAAMPEPEPAPEPNPTEWRKPTLAEEFGAPPAPAFVHGITHEYISRPDNTFVFGVVSDNHAGSKYERLDVLRDLYDRFAQAGADRVFHAGNWIDGDSRFNTHDVHTRGMDAQIRHLIDIWPRVGIDTYAVHGDDHEGWYGQREGVDVGRYCQHLFRDHGRNDWIDLGFMEAYVRLVNANTGQAAIMSVAHPGGGTAYALSYTVQQIINSLEGGEKPAVAIYGHYHKLGKFQWRNVWALLAGCCCDQTPFMRKKKIPAHVGGSLVKLEQDPDTGAIIGCGDQTWQYFNTGYYQNRWSMSGAPQLAVRTVGGWRVKSR